MVNYIPKMVGDNQDKDSITVDEVMLKSYVSFNEEMGIDEAAKLLIKKKITGAPVINTEKKAIGFLSEKDCLKYVTEMKYYNSVPGKVKDYMSTTIVKIPVGTDLFHAVDLFSNHPFHCYPVTQDDFVVGVIYRSNVLSAVYKMKQVTW